MRILPIGLLAAIGAIACGQGDQPPKGSAVFAATSVSERTVTLDGSSTVFPVSRAIVQAFNDERHASVQVAFSGTGGGFKRFCRGETTINGASRPIKASEVELCQNAGIRYIELPIGMDPLTVVVNTENSWASWMTTAELRQMWEPAAERKITRWNQVRSDWPDRELHLFGAGNDSGTFDYFTKAIVGEEHRSRGDYTGSEDDDLLVDSVVKDPAALAFFGYAYYAKNRSRLKLIAIDDGKDENGRGPIVPSPETVRRGRYQPLTRPLFIYVNRVAADREEVSDFVKYFVREAGPAVTAAGYLALPESAYDRVLARFEHRIAGTLFEGHGSTVGVRTADLVGER